MRRWISLALLLVLLLVTCRAMVGAETLAAQSRSVSLRYKQPLDEAVVEQVLQKSPGITFWAEETVSLTAAWHTAGATALYYTGDAWLVWGQPCRVGSMPGPLDTGGCAISTALAWELFGSEEPVGLALEDGQQSYIVRGVFESGDCLALLPRAAGAFTAVELPVDEDTAQDPMGWTSRQLQQAGLPTADWQLYPSLPAGLARLLAWLPVILAAGLLLAALPGWARRWPVWAREGAVFGVLLAAALALPWLLGLWPQWLTPSRWSDFSWWSQTADQLGEYFSAWLKVYPAGRDVAFKTGLLAQLGLAAVQAGLWEALRCSLQPKQKPN